MFQLSHSRIEPWILATLALLVAKAHLMRVGTKEKKKADQDWRISLVSRLARSTPKIETQTHRSARTLTESTGKPNKRLVGVRQEDLCWTKNSLQHVQRIYKTCLITRVVLNTRKSETNCYCYSFQLILTAQPQPDHKLLASFIQQTYHVRVHPISLLSPQRATSKLYCKGATPNNGEKGEQPPDRQNLPRQLIAIKSRSRTRRTPDQGSTPPPKG
ncbi:unnamed protein product [Ectocarpus sp. 12 AP-2014]